MVCMQTYILCLMNGIVCDKAAYSNDFPDFAQPLPVGHYSKHANGSVTYDKSQLRVLNKEALNANYISFDLNEGFDRLVEKPFDRLDYLLRWILYHRKQKHVNPTRSLKDILHNVDFVSWRGLLTRVGSTLYKLNDGWIICVCRVQDVYFLCEFDTAMKTEQLKNQSEREKLMTFWGHRFEHYVTLNKASSEGIRLSNEEADVNLNEEFCYIVRSKLNGCHRLIFGAEVDAADPETGSLIELKTNIIIQTERQRKCFERYKSVSWWLQSFLVGIDKIVCGYRDNDGIVRCIKQITLTDIVKQGENYWSGSKCFNFLAQFLATIKHKITTNDASLVYKFEYDPVKKSVDFGLDLNKDHHFLPDWFLDDIVN